MIQNSLNFRIIVSLLMHQYTSLHLPEYFKAAIYEMISSIIFWLYGSLANFWEYAYNYNKQFAFGIRFV